MKRNIGGVDHILSLNQNSCSEKRLGKKRKKKLVLIQQDGQSNLQIKLTCNGCRRRLGTTGITRF